MKKSKLNAFIVTIMVAMMATLIIACLEAAFGAHNVFVGAMISLLPMIIITLILDHKVKKLEKKEHDVKGGIRL